MPLIYSVATNNFTLFTHGFVQSLEFLKKPWNLPSNFPDLEKVWNIERKPGETVKSLKFFFSKLQQVFLKWFYFLRFGQILFNLARTFAVRAREKLRVEIVETSLRKELPFRDATSGFPAKWRLRKERRNSIQMTCHYLDLGSVSDWSCRVGNLLKQIRTTSQIWEVTLIGWKFALTN